jgi:hypothetical protein
MERDLTGVEWLLLKISYCASAEGRKPSPKVSIESLLRARGPSMHRVAVLDPCYSTREQAPARPLVIPSPAEVAGAIKARATSVETFGEGATSPVETFGARTSVRRSIETHLPRR